MKCGIRDLNTKEIFEISMNYGLDQMYFLSVIKKKITFKLSTN